MTLDGTGATSSGRTEDGTVRKDHKRRRLDAAGEKLDPVSDIRRLINSIKTYVDNINERLPVDKVAFRRAAHGLAEHAKQEENVETLVNQGGVEAIVPLLTLPDFPRASDEQGEAGPSGADDPDKEAVEKEACFTIGLLAIKPDHQRRIADANALPGLVKLLERHPSQHGTGVSSGGGVARRAADAIVNLAHENVAIKSRVRTEGGIPPLVALLESMDLKVQRAAAGALRTLAFKNEENKNQIVECGALPALIFMLRSEDVGIHYEAVGVIGNLVHSSPSIKKKVLEEGALQPVIGLLSSSCTESQREAALLLGQFATTEPACKVHIVQRGAVLPLITMLTSEDNQLREMAAFALGRLAQDQHNQAGICHAGGLRPLLDLLDSGNGSLQHNAAFALYGLADNEDNVADIIREGGVQRLMDGELIVQASKDCVQKTLKRLEEKIQGRVLNHLLYLLRASDGEVQHRVAVSLAHLADEENYKQIFIDRRGLDVLMEMLLDFRESAEGRLKEEAEITKRADERVTLLRAAEGEAAAGRQNQRDAALALFKLSSRRAAAETVAPPPPTPNVYLGEQFVNNETLSDVIFVVDGTRFYAHRIALLASSDAFRAMFDGGYKEKNASDIEIPNIRLPVFRAMMKCIYTGNVEVTQDIAQELLRAADQYLLDGLKRLCENAIAENMSVDNLPQVYELAENYSAPQLARRCVLFALEKHQELVGSRPYVEYTALIRTMAKEIRSQLVTTLTQPRPEDSPVAAAAPVTDAAAA